MAEVRVNAYVHAPCEAVFAHMSDHVRVLSSRTATCSIHSPGPDETNGLGCIREVRAKGIHLLEEVTHFDRPKRYDYRIIKSNLPLEHEGGSLHFHHRGDGTEIDWVTRFTVPVPVVGGALSQIVCTSLTTELTKVLMRAKDTLER